MQSVYPADTGPARRPTRARGARPVTLALLLLGAPAADTSAGPPDGAGPACPLATCRYAGRPLITALEDLRARGLNLVFSSDLVRPDLIVETEPPIAAPRQVLNRILAPFGLDARDGPAGTILIVRAMSIPSDGSDAADGAAREPLPARPPLREEVRVGPSTDGEPAPVTTLNQEAIDRLPSVADDPARSITWLPGIAPADKSAELSIRGGESDETTLILDGLEIDEPYHLKDILSFSSLVDGRAIGRTDIRTGIFPVEYGDRMSGVVDMTTADVPDALGGVVDLSLISASFLSGGSLGDNATWLISARSWFPDAVLDIIDPGGEDLSPSYHDLLGKMEMRLAGGSLLSAHLLASRDVLDYRADLDDVRVGAGDDHRHAWITWKVPLSARLFVQTLASSGTIVRSRHGSIVESAGGIQQVDEDRSFGSAGLKQDWMFDAGPRASLKWGFGARRLEAEYLYRSHVVQSEAAFPAPTGSGATPPAIDRDLMLEPSGGELGAYASGLFRPIPPLAVEVGIRRDRQTLTDETETSPRANLAWSVDERTILRIGWGRFFQPQGINELQIEDGVLGYFPAQRADQWEVDLDRRLADGLKLAVAVYLKEMSRVRPRYENLFDPMQLFPEAETDRVLVAPERAVARGFEIGLASDGGRPLNWRASYALAWAQDEIEGAWVPKSIDQRHTVNLGLSYRRGDRWDFSVAGVYHTGWPTTEVGAEQVVNPDGSVGIQPILGPRNGARQPPYHRLDLRVTRRFRVGHGTLDAYLDVTNLYGRDNVCCVREFQYLPQPDGSVRVRRVEGYWLADLPVVGLTWRF